jgi:CheY-like chemotaxis protein
VRAEERDLWVSADPNQIEQVLMNLTVNARDAMPDGGACFIDAGRVSVGNAPLIRLRVRDTGIGMDAAVKERIFEPFFTTKGAGAGTGLGLSTAYGVVRQHGGSISVESSPGAGATFEVLLPAAEDATLATAGAASAAAGPSGTETVLLVEDEEGVRRVAERFLRRQGYDVHVASSGAEALEIAARLGRPIDLLFTDVMMPAMSGRELAERLRVMQPDLKVLFVSGYTGDYLQTQTGELPPGTHLLYKPYALGRTAQLIREILEGQPVLER